jgi:hypothetical protein
MALDPQIVEARISLRVAELKLLAAQTLAARLAAEFELAAQRQPPNPVTRNIAHRD